MEREHAAGEPEDLEFSSFMFWRNPLPNIDRDLQELLVRPWLLPSPGDTHTLAAATPVGWELVNSVTFQIDEGADVPSEEEESGFEERREEDSDDDGGWITPSNIKQIQRDFEQCTVPKDVWVGCVTTDFAMQVGGTGVS